MPFPLLGDTPFKLKHPIQAKNMVHMRKNAETFHSLKSIERFRRYMDSRVMPHIGACGVAAILENGHHGRQEAVTL